MRRTRKIGLLAVIVAVGFLVAGHEVAFGASPTQGTAHTVGSGRAAQAAAAFAASEGAAQVVKSKSTVTPTLLTSTSLALPPGTYASNTPVFGQTFTPASNSTVTVTLNGGSSEAGCLKLYVDAVLSTDADDVGIAGCHVFGPGPTTWTWSIPVPTSGLAHLALENMGQLTLTSGTVMYAAAPPWTPPAGTSTFSLTPGTYISTTSPFGQLFSVADDSTVTIHLSGTSGEAGCVKLYVQNVLITDQNDVGIPGCHEFVGGPRYWNWSIPLTSGGSARLTLENMGRLTLTDGTVAYGPTSPPSDSSAPTITYTQSPDGSNGWFKSTPATVTVTATDADDNVSSIDCTLDGSAVTLTNTSGLGTATTASGEISTSVDGDHAVSCAATDSHSNTTAPAMTTELKLDVAAPLISDAGFAAGTAGLNGWYVSAVRENFTAFDATSGLTDCSATFSKDSGTSEGGAVTIASGSCSDKAGNTALGINSASYKIDLTDPYAVTFVGGPADGASYSFGSVPAAPTCTASDLISGFDHCTVTGYGTTAGSHTLTATAYDVAGRRATATLSYTVLGWTLHGFFQPVDMSGVWNNVEGGSTVPFKFSIFAGSSALTDSADVKGFTATPATCPNGSTTTDAIEVTATGGTSLRYAGQFIYNWQTPKSAGACYVVTMTALDGSTLSANFILK